MTTLPENSSETSAAAADLATRSAVWTRHWATGAAHSCVGSYGDRYGGAIADFWTGIFASLSGAQRVLDVATGNGALPRLLLDSRPGMAISIDAIDLAHIAPAWLAHLPLADQSRVRFCGECAAEDLGFPDGAFDLVVSQYGIEYSKLDRSVPEMLRVLAPGGRIALLLHAADSRPATLAAVELTHLAWLLSDNGLLAAAAAMLEPISRAITAEGRAALANDPRAEAARERFNAAQDLLRERCTVPDGADVLFEVQDAVNAVLGLAASRSVSVAQDRLVAITTAARDSQHRLQQLCTHTLTPSGLEALCESIRRSAAPGTEVVLGEVREQGLLMGRTLVTRAPEAPNS